MFRPLLQRQNYKKISKNINNYKIIAKNFYIIDFFQHWVVNKFVFMENNSDLCTPFCEELKT